jgi:3D (Asp-Asp-Asp) domain-containing protein
MTNICESDEKIVACNWLPIDTMIEIDGEVYRVADRMNRRYQKPYMDILVDTKEEALEKGRQTKLIYLIK